MRSVVMLCVASVGALTSTAAWAGKAAPSDEGLLAFQIDGVEVMGHTLTVAPVAGPPITSLERMSFEVVGAAGGLIDDAYFEYLDGTSEGLEGLDLEPADGTSIEVSDDGVRLTGTDCRFGGLRPQKPEGVYFGVGFNWDIGDNDGDGLCDGARKDNFVFGQTMYVEAIAAGGGGFLDGQTIYMEARVGGQAGKRVLSADVGTELCHVGVWNDDGLVYTTIAPCAEIGGVSDPGGDTNKEEPLDQHFSRVWSDVVNDWVTKVVWTWTGGGIDISYHYPGMAWVD